MSGNPLNRISVYSIEAGGPILRDRLWYWGAWDHQDINAGVANFFDPSKGSACQALIAAQNAAGAGDGHLVQQPRASSELSKERQDGHQGSAGQGQLPAEPSEPVRVPVRHQRQDPQRPGRRARIPPWRRRRSSSPTRRMASPRTRPTRSSTRWSLATSWCSTTCSPTWVAGSSSTTRTTRPAASSRYLGCHEPRRLHHRAALKRRLPLESAVSDEPHHQLSTAARSTGSYQTVRPTWEVKTDGTYFLTNKLGGDHSLKFGVGWRKAPILSFSHYSGGAARHDAVRRQQRGRTAARTSSPPGTSTTGLVPYQAVLYRDQLRNNDWWTYNGYIQDSFSRGRLARQRRPALRLAAVEAPWRLRAGEHAPSRICSRRSATRRRCRTSHRPEDPVVRQLVATPRR